MQNIRTHNLCLNYASPSTEIETLGLFFAVKLDSHPTIAGLPVLLEVIQEAIWYMSKNEEEQLNTELISSVEDNAGIIEKCSKC